MEAIHQVNAVIQAIQSGKQNILHQLTLDQMRYTYQDRLADFHCLEKTIWRLSVSLVVFLPGSGQNPRRARKLGQFFIMHDDEDENDGKMMLWRIQDLATQHKYTAATATPRGTLTAQDFDFTTEGYEFIYHEQSCLVLDALQHANNGRRSSGGAGGHGGSAGHDGCPGHDGSSGRRRSSRPVPKPTTVDVIRKTYHDWLADFYCFDKTVWELTV
nr:hypothetical protein BaRGS_025549 [Batillaria attramentaria]